MATEFDTNNSQEWEYIYIEGDTSWDLGRPTPVFVDITNPYEPFEIDRIEGSSSIWRDIKYWNRHVYIGTEANDGIKIVSVDDFPVMPSLS